MRRYELRIDLPCLPRGAQYDFDDETAEVYRVDTDDPVTYALRPALANYLWLLLTFGKKYLKLVEDK